MVDVLIAEGFEDVVLLVPERGHAVVGPGVELVIERDGERLVLAAHVVLGQRAVDLPILQRVHVLHHLLITAHRTRTQHVSGWLTPRTRAISSMCAHKVPS